VFDSGIVRLGGIERRDLIIVKVEGDEAVHTTSAPIRSGGDVSGKRHVCRMADCYPRVACDRHRKRGFDPGSGHLSMHHVGGCVRSDGEHEVPIRDRSRVECVQYLVDLGGVEESSIGENAGSLDRTPRVLVRRQLALCDSERLLLGFRHGRTLSDHATGHIGPVNYPCRTATRCVVRRKCRPNRPKSRQ
jgi:hypothetical protein